MGSLRVLAGIFAIYLLFIPHTYTKETDFDYDEYNSYESMIQELKRLEREHKEISVQAIGLTYEKRTIYMVKVASDPNHRKSGIFVDGNTHAREWVTSVITMNLIKTLAEEPVMLEQVDWYIVPMVNPDGYEYSRKHNKNWRKNRAQFKFSQCVGVDINRNFPIYWGLNGASLDPCHPDVYAGPYAKSEEETQAISSALRRNKLWIKAYISSHSYGRLILYPYGFNNIAPPNEANLKFVGHKMREAIQEASSCNYTVEQASTLYKTGGSSDDYAYTVLNIPYVYTIEFTGGFGFNYPEKQLDDAVKEAMPAFVVLAEFIGKHG